MDWHSRLLIHRDIAEFSSHRSCFTGKGRGGIQCSLPLHAAMVTMPGEEESLSLELRTAAKWVHFRFSSVILTMAVRENYGRQLQREVGWKEIP